MGALRGSLEPLWRVPAYEKDLQFYLGAAGWWPVGVMDWMSTGCSAIWMRLAPRPPCMSGQACAALPGSGSCCRLFAGGI